MKRLIGLIILAGCLTGPSTLFAESAPMHFCSKPHKPYQFTDEDEVESFKRDVARYKLCINEFVAEQEDDIKQHRSAANDAIEEWNSFVQRELRYGAPGS